MPGDTSIGKLPLFAVMFGYSSLKVIGITNIIPVGRLTIKNIN
jgi:hypothetical protein